MTTPEQPPDWATDIPSADVHRGQQDSGYNRPFSAQQMLSFGGQLIEQFLRRVVQALVGFFIPGGGSAFNQLSDWADGVNHGLQNFGTLVTGIDFSQPPLEVWKDIVAVFLKPLNVFAELVGGFIDSIRIPILDPSKILNLPGVIGNLQGFLSGVVEALTGSAGDPNDYVDPVNQLKYMADTVSGHTQAIEALKAANAGQENSGVSGGDDFQIPYNGSLGPGWALSSTNGITTYVDTSTGKAEWHNAGNANPILTARRTDPADANTLGEYQKVTATIATPLGGTNSQVRVYGRMSADGLHYVVAYVSNSTVFIAYAAGGAETVVDSGPLPTGVKLINGAQLSLECGTAESRDEYRVRISGVQAQSFDDTTNLVTTSVNYASRGLAEAPKGWGVGWRPGLNLGSWYRPATLSGCTIADNIPSEIQGHGFRVYREATTGSGSLSVGDILAPFYDEIDYVSPGSAWSASGYVVPKTGMWAFSHRLFKSGNNWSVAGFTLKINGVGRTAGAAWRDLNVAQDSFLYHCEKGDVVTPALGLVTGSVAVAMNGSSSGLDSYFSGALVGS